MKNQSDFGEGERLSILRKKDRKNKKIINPVEMMILL